MQKTKNVASILSKNSWLLHKQFKWILIMPPTSFWINVYFEISDTSIPFDPTVFFNFQEKQNQKVIFKNTYWLSWVIPFIKKEQGFLPLFFSQTNIETYRKVVLSTLKTLVPLDISFLFVIITLSDLKIKYA